VAAEHSGQSLVYDRVPTLFLAVDEPEEQVGASDSLFPQTFGRNHPRCSARADSDLSSDAISSGFLRIPPRGTTPWQ
jgi:hypothetical protein